MMLLLNFINREQVTNPILIMAHWIENEWDLPEVKSQIYYQGNFKAR